MITNKEKTNISGFNFVIGKRVHKSIKSDINRNSRIYFEFSLIVSIIFTTSLFLLFPKVSVPVKEITTPNIVLNIQDIPPTTNPGRKALKPPSRPFIPVESDIAELEAEITEEWSDFTLADLPDLPGNGGFGGVNGLGAISKINPRPILEVIPEYNVKDIEKGISGMIELFIKIDEKGTVISVFVLKNTTGSQLLEKAAVEASLKTKYLPAKLNGNPVGDEITRSFSFKLSDPD